MKASAFWKELVPALAFFAFGVAVFWETTRMSDSFSIGVGMDARTYPRILALLCIGLSSILMVKSIYRVLLGNSENPELALQAEPRSDLAKLGMSLGTFALYALLLHDLGFAIATSLLVAGNLLIAGERRIWLVALYSVTSTLLVQYLVRAAFSIALPESPFATL